VRVSARCGRSVCAHVRNMAKAMAEAVRHASACTERRASPSPPCTHLQPLHGRRQVQALADGAPEAGELRGAVRIQHCLHAARTHPYMRACLCIHAFAHMCEHLHPALPARSTHIQHPAQAHTCAVQHWAFNLGSHSIMLVGLLCCYAV